MTKMLIDRSTVEQALLEALKISLRLIRTHVEPEAIGAERFDLTDSKEMAPVFAALEAALAEPIAPSDCPHSHQPVAWMVYTLDGKSVCVTDNPTDFTEQHKALPLYTAPTQGGQR